MVADARCQMMATAKTELSYLRKMYDDDDTHMEEINKLLCIFPVSLLRQSFLCAHTQIKLLMIF